MPVSGMTNVLRHLGFPRGSPLMAHIPLHIGCMRCKRNTGPACGELYMLDLTIAAAPE